MHHGSRAEWEWLACVSTDAPWGIGPDCIRAAWCIGALCVELRHSRIALHAVSGDLCIWDTRPVGQALPDLSRVPAGDESRPKQRVRRNTHCRAVEDRALVEDVATVGDEGPAVGFG